jgi:hypothetical protein
MSHREFMAQCGTGFHLAWNGEDVYIGSTTAEPVSAVVDLGLPLRNNDRGDGVLARGQLLFSSDEEILFGTPIWIRYERWEYESERKPEDGNRLVFVVRREQNMTSSRFGGYQRER